MKRQHRGKECLLLKQCQCLVPPKTTFFACCGYICHTCGGRRNVETSVQPWKGKR